MFGQMSQYKYYVDLGRILYITQVSEKYEHTHREPKPKVIFCKCGTKTAQCGITAVYNKQHS